MNTVRSIRICDNNTVNIRRDTGTRTYKNVRDHRITTLFRAITARGFATYRTLGAVEFWNLTTP
mgnify:CR=1 FL=1